MGKAGKTMTINDGNFEQLLNVLQNQWQYFVVYFGKRNCFSVDSRILNMARFLLPRNDSVFSEMSDFSINKQFNSIKTTLKINDSLSIKIHQLFVCCQ